MCPMDAVTTEPAPGTRDVSEASVFVAHLATNFATKRPTTRTHEEEHMIIKDEQALLVIEATEWGH